VFIAHQKKLVAIAKAYEAYRNALTEARESISGRERIDTFKLVKKSYLGDETPFKIAWNSLRDMKRNILKEILRVLKI